MGRLNASDWLIMALDGNGSQICTAARLTQPTIPIVSDSQMILKLWCIQQTIEN